MNKVFSARLKSFAVCIVAVLLLSSMLMPLNTGCDGEQLVNNNPKEEPSMPNEPDDTANTIGKLDPAIELLIRQTALDSFRARKDEPNAARATIDEITIAMYWGTYDGAVVITFGGSGGYFSTDLFLTETAEAAGYHFEFTNANFIFVWKDGYLYGSSRFSTSLPSAYADGVLTKEDIADIHKKWMADRAHLEK